MKPQMYIEYRNGEPVAFRYGEPWVAMQLYVEGGYPTEQEAIEAWHRSAGGNNNENDTSPTP